MNKDYKIFYYCFTKHIYFNIKIENDLDKEFQILFNHRLNIEWEAENKYNIIKSKYYSEIGLHNNCNKNECKKYHLEFQKIQQDYLNTIGNYNPITNSINDLMKFRLRNWYWKYF